jgi:MFS family permease
LVLMALTSLFGLGVAAVTASTAAMVSDLSRASAYGSALGVLSSIMDVGHASGPAVTGYLVAGWHYGPAFGVVAGVLIVGAVLFYTLVREPALMVREEMRSR